jgi:DNA primase
MFPIRDRRGRAISFGGRIMGDGQPKYVNGPETALFSKRRTLYGLDLAREAVRRGGVVVVVEGYMDVIALGQAGFEGAVAPLGTALTEEQLSELWRLSPAPVLCFDGDGAGARAAARAAELALPMLAPDRTLRLIALPAGEDPDSLVRSRGAPAFQAMLDTARPLSECLYDLLREGTGEATPEQRAAFRTRLEEAAKRIPDKALAGEYRSVLLDRFFASRKRGAHRGAPGPAAQAVRPRTDAAEIAAERARILTAILLRHPNLYHDVEHAYAGLDLDPMLTRIRDAMAEWAAHAEVLDSQALMDHLDGFGLRADVGKILAGTPVPLPACASSGAMPAEAEEGWWHIFGFLNVDRLREEVNLAREDAARGLTGETERKLVALISALNKVRMGEPDGTDLAAA